jgi:uncharacterized protein (TIGR02246 family)
MSSRNLVRCLAVILLGISFVAESAAARSNEPNRSLTTADQNAIRATIEAYRATWLANDAKGVLKTFTDDAVLMPAHGKPPVVGIADIEKYWFAPGGPATVVTGLDITVEQIDGNATVAFARGSDRVTWTVTEDGVTHRHFHPGTYLNVMKKMPDGSWRIQVHMWDDGPENVD